jgi:hypothetical protein
MRYSVNPADMRSIVNDIEAALQRLRNVRVTVDRLSTPEAREKSTAASTDPMFQKFLGRLLPGGDTAH